ncbi:MAG: GNAT family N-acetyltransferase [Actinomycetota bacterium]|nr:GNAT family N-acetyltransferase [Actinomycetota bacterium]
MSEQTLVEPMRAPDIDAVLRLLGILFAQERDFAPHETRQRAALERLLAEPSLGVVLVARRDGRVIGSVTLLRSISTALGAEVAWLEDLVVQPTDRGNGTGHALLNACATFAAAQGWQRISLLTDHDNRGAQRLYARHGYTHSEMVVLRRQA